MSVQPSSCYHCLLTTLMISLFKGLYPLWGRQIPYTMMKFASFENIVEAIYGYMPKKKSEYGRGTQTAVSFAGGYAGKSSSLTKTARIRRH